MDGQPAPDGWSVSLQLVDGQVHALVIERAEGALDAVLADQPAEVAFLAAGESEELPIRARRVFEDRPPDQVQEVVLATLETAAHDPQRFVPPDRSLVVAGQAADEPRGVREIAQACHSANRESAHRLTVHDGSPEHSMALVRQTT